MKYLHFANKGRSAQNASTSLLSVLLPGASTAILTLGVLMTGLLFIAPIHVKKPGLPALCALALIGAAELAGLIMLAL